MPDSPRPHSPRPSATEPALAAIREALATFPPPLLQEFDEACTQLQERLDADALLAWADEGLAVARHSLRAWEAASVYCRVSAAVLDQLPLPHFQAWAGSGRDLAADSRRLTHRHGDRRGGARCRHRLISTMASRRRSRRYRRAINASLVLLKARAIAARSGGSSPSVWRSQTTTM